MRKLFALIVAAGICLLCYSGPLYSQDQIDPLERTLNIPSRYISKVQEKFSWLDKQLTRQTEKYLKRLAKQEEKLLHSISKLDSTVPQQLTESYKFYGELGDKLNIKANTENVSITGEYLPYIDSIQTSLEFINKSDQLLAKSMDYKKKLQGSLSEVKLFQAKLQQTENIKEYIRLRKEQIKDHFRNFTTVPGNISKAYSGYTKELYYYSAQIKEYKSIANDPDKLTRKALTMLRKSEAFQEFCRKYSQLADLFGLPANYANAANTGGLQTKSQVSQIIQSQLSAAGPNGIHVLEQNVQAARDQLSQLKGKVNGLSNKSDDIDMPTFKPNTQRTKTFWRRLEYGTNFQTTKNNFFPTTTDFGFSVGYKISDKSVVGIGACYKMGWGKDIKHIVISHEGMGLRSFLDLKIKGSFFASGGFEYNFQPLQLNNMISTGHIDNISSWNKSGLLGISKIVSIKSNFFKKTKLQLLWDFLSHEQIPQGQALKFRVGYNF